MHAAFTAFFGPGYLLAPDRSERSASEGESFVAVQGSAGQSFACFLVAGIKLRLVGEANDYVGKGMAGGEVVIIPPPGSRFKAEEASLVGNTCLYGATGGRLFVNGRAGESWQQYLFTLLLVLTSVTANIDYGWFACTFSFC